MKLHIKNYWHLKPSLDIILNPFFYSPEPQNNYFHPNPISKIKTQEDSTHYLHS